MMRFVKPNTSIIAIAATAMLSIMPVSSSHAKYSDPLDTIDNWCKKYYPTELYDCMYELGYCQMEMTLKCIDFFTPKPVPVKPTNITPVTPGNGGGGAYPYAPVDPNDEMIPNCNKPGGQCN